MSCLLRLSGVTKSFGVVRALKGVSFDLQAGEVHALLGENGAGKSTLIKIITGAHSADGGTLEVAGQSIPHMSPATARHFGIACIYQQPALFPDLSVAENIGLRVDPPRAAQRIPWNPWRQRARQLLDRIGARIDVDTEIRHLSMPQQQLVEIACALGSEARIVIMDEPTASLTQNEQALLLGIVRDLRQHGVGIIYISHRLEEILTLADRVTVLRDGESVGTRTVGSSLDSRPPVDKDSTVRADNKPSPKSRAATTSRELTAAELIHMMVGREIDQLYPPGGGQSGDIVLSLRDVGCAASGLRDVTLEVRAGEIVGLAGLIGAGRTELAQVLFGLTPADRGEILLRGQRIAPCSPPEAVTLGIAYVPEDRRRHGLILELPISANVSMALHRRLFPGMWLRFGAERSLAQSFIERLQIRTTGPDALGRSLSGGNQQKVALARWLATEPKLLILDEPTQGVDVGAKSEIHRIIRTLAAQGLAILLISSDLPEVLGMSDRIVVMRGGTVASVLPRCSDAATVMAAALGRQELRP